MGRELDIENARVVDADDYQDVDAETAPDETGVEED